MATGKIPVRGAKLLWTNPDTSSAFTAQTVQVDLTGLSMVLINFKITKGDTGGTDFIFVIDSGSHSAWCLSMPPTGNTSYGFSRSVSFSSTGVVFAAATKKTLLSGDRATSNDNMIPATIYGIK